MTLKKIFQVSFVIILFLILFIDDILSVSDGSTILLNTQTREFLTGITLIVVLWMCTYHVRFKQLDLIRKLQFLGGVVFILWAFMRLVLIFFPIPTQFEDTGDTKF